MRGIVFPSIAWVACYLLLGCYLSAAQESAPKLIEEIRPSIYYLKDKNGQLQAVPNFTYEDFVELWNLKNHIGHQDERPLYSIQRLSASGTAKDNHVELTVDVTVLTRQKDWVRVPLRMEGAMLHELVQYKGPGELFLHFENDGKGNGKGYVCWIRGDTGGQHKLSLKMLVPLKTVGETTRLELRAPRATASELKLTVPLSNVTGGVSEGAILSPPVGSSSSTEFTVRGLSPDFELTWHKAQGRVAKVLTVLEATGLVLVRMDSRSIETEANLLVHSNGTAFDRCLVRLPQGAKLAPGSSSGHSITVINGQGKTAKNHDDAEQTVVEVRRAEKVTDPMEVRLVSTRPYSISKSHKWLDLSGFEVIDAARQWGQIAVVAPDDWHVLWGPGEGIRQTEQINEELRHEDAVAGFDYFSQPYSLTARLEPRTARVSVEPEYLLLVDADQVRLQATLKYTVRGAKTFLLKVALPQWEIEEVGPENLVDVDRVLVDDNNMLLLPLLQPSTGQLELKISARLPIKPSDDVPGVPSSGVNSLSVPLPRPEANSLGPAAIVVLVADNLELIPNREATEGLIRQQVDPPMELPHRQQEPLFYRGEVSNSLFAAEFRVRPQAIDVKVASKVDIDPDGGSVKQTLAYTVKHEPADHLLVDVPQSLAKLDNLTFKYDGRVVVPVDVTEKTATETDKDQPAKGLSRMRVALSQPCIGDCELLVGFRLPLEKLTLSKPLEFNLPLVMPAEGKLSGNTLLVTVTPEIAVEYVGRGWSPVSLGSTAAQREYAGLRLESREVTDRVKLSLRLEDSGSSKATIVERAWVQTWLAADLRQDRAVFRFTSNRNELDFFVPPGADTEGMFVMLDGKRISAKIARRESSGAESSEGPGLRIPLSTGDGNRQHLLELRYHFPDKRRHYGKMSLELPHLADKVWVRRMYWQLVLPRNEHVVVPPTGFTGEFTWGWTGAFWGRQPLLGQKELETWSGAVRQTAVPQATNRYLFSSLGDVQECKFSTAARSWIVLVASGAALVAGLLLIYVPASRHPGCILAVAVLLLCVGVIYPEPTLLIAQAAILGLGLTLLAGLLERSVARRRRTAAPPEKASSILEKGSSQTQPGFPTPDRPSSVRVSSTVAPPPTPDSNA